MEDEINSRLQFNNDNQIQLCEDISYMKTLWSTSRNSMLSETVAAEFKIRLNCKMKP